jgi:hypothetical protein
LRFWCDRLEESGDRMDWRSLLHPSARVQSSGAATSARPIARQSKRRTWGVPAALHRNHRRTSKWGDVAGDRDGQTATLRRLNTGGLAAPAFGHSSADQQALRSRPLYRKSQIIRA